MSLLYFQSWDVYVSTLEINHDNRTIDAWPFQDAFDISLVSGVNGNNALLVNDDGWVWQSLDTPIEQGMSITVGFACRAQLANESFAGLAQASAPTPAGQIQLDFGLTVGGSIAVRTSQTDGNIIRKSDYAVFSGLTGGWRHVEFSFQVTTSATVAMWVDGSAATAFASTVDVVTNNRLPWTQIRFGAGNANRNDRHIDNVYITNDAGGAGVPKGRLDVTNLKVSTFSPVRNGAPTQWTVSSAVSSHILIADDDPDDYVIATAIAQYEMWGIDVSGIIGQGDIIHFVKQYSFMDKVNPGSAAIQQIVSAVGSTNQIGSAHVPTANVVDQGLWHHDIWETKNGVTKWNFSALHNGEFGIRTLR